MDLKGLLVRLFGPLRVTFMASIRIGFPSLLFFLSLVSAYLAQYPNRRAGGFYFFSFQIFFRKRVAASTHVTASFVFAHGYGRIGEVEKSRHRPGALGFSKGHPGGG